MKRIFSICILFVLALNVFGSTLIVSASKVTQDGEKFVREDALIIGNVESTSEMPDTGSVVFTDSVSLYPVFEKTHYKNNESIFVHFELNESFVGVSTIYECDGFSVVGSVRDSQNEETGCQGYDVFLSHDGVSAYPYFRFSVITDDTSVVCAEIYGYLSDHGLFVNDSSHDSAKSSSYYYFVENGSLTMDEYNAIMEREYSKHGMIFIDDATEINTTSTHTASTMSAVTETTVSGNFAWGDDDDVMHPLQYNKVEIWDDRFGEMLGVVYTDVSGDFSFSYVDEYDYRDIYIKIYSAGENATVLNGDGGDYVCVSPIRQNVIPGSDIRVSGEVYMDNAVGRAFQISQAVNVATQYVKQMHGDYLTAVEVRYPHTKVNQTGCYYWNDVIYIKERTPEPGCPETYASWDVIMHEYGHHIQDELDIEFNPGGQHYINHNLADDTNSKDEGIRLAWGEAYPSVFGGMAQAYYASTLQNIATVGDTMYQSYNGALLNYETIPYRIGEACEASIIGVLWDLYDTTAEAHDGISFTHENYWDMITNSGAYTMSDFCNYFVDRYDSNKDQYLGRLLAYYKMSPTEVTADVSGATPTFSWTANGTSSTLQNDEFDLLVYGVYQGEPMRIEGITTTSYTLSEEEWETILFSYGTKFSVVVVAYQTDSPVTGGYYSAPLQIVKPAYNDSSEIVQNTPGKTRYSEKSLTLTPNSYYDLYVTFGVAGSKLIQTFGAEDTVLELYSASGDLLVGADETDDAGYLSNALMRYDTAVDTQYIIRVRMYDEKDSGMVKIAITPAEGVCAPNVNAIECYEDIRSFTGSSSLTWSATLELNHTSVITFTAPVSGSYTFETTGVLDTILYVIDPRSPNTVVRFADYDNDSGTDLNAKLTKTLTAGVPYFIIYTSDDVESAGNAGNLVLSVTAG